MVLPCASPKTGKPVTAATGRKPAAAPVSAVPCPACPLFLSGKTRPDGFRIAAAMQTVANTAGRPRQAGRPAFPRLSLQETPLSAVKTASLMKKTHRLRQ